MRSPSMPEPGRPLRMARRSVGVFFFLNGAMTAALSARLPALRERLALSPEHLGLALLGCTLGGLLALIGAARLAGRFGSKPITILAAICMLCAFFALACAPTFLSLTLALFCFGAGSGALDIATNIQGTEIERGYARPLLNSFYACFSVGTLVSGILGSGLAAYNVSPLLHFLVLALVSASGSGLSARFLLARQPEAPLAEVQTPAGRATRFSGQLILLGVLAFCALLCVGAMFDWSAVYLAGTLHTGEGLAGMGFTVFLACMALGRAVGDTLVLRFGSVVLVRGACLLAALGLVLTLVWNWPPAALCGLGLVGLGLSIPFPMALRAAARLPGRSTESTLAIVSTWGYGGILVGPAAIGFLASRVGLRLALTLLVFLCLLAALCAPGVYTAGENEDEH